MHVKSSLVGGPYSFDPKDRSRSTEINCKRNIAGHKSMKKPKLNLSGQGRLSPSPRS